MMPGSWRQVSIYFVQISCIFRQREGLVCPNRRHFSFKFHQHTRRATVLVRTSRHDQKKVLLKLYHLPPCSRKKSLVNETNHCLSTWLGGQFGKTKAWKNVNILRLIRKTLSLLLSSAISTPSVMFTDQQGDVSPSNGYIPCIQRTLV